MKRIINYILNKLLAVYLLGYSCMGVQAQTIKYEEDKAGKFILSNHLQKCPGQDFAVLTKFQRFYFLNPLEKELAPGVQLYAGGRILVSNPNQPSPWIPATIGEVTTAVLEYYKVIAASEDYTYKKMLDGMTEEVKKIYTQTPRVVIYDILCKQFDKLSPDDLKKPAYYDSHEVAIWSINASGQGIPVVKFNPDCWNRNLPSTLVQFVSLKYEITSENEFNQFLKNNDQLKDYEGLFINAIPVEKLGALIQH